MRCSKSLGNQRLSTCISYSMSFICRYGASSAPALHFLFQDSISSVSRRGQMYRDSKPSRPSESEASLWSCWLRAALAKPTRNLLACPRGTNQPHSLRRCVTRDQRIRNPSRWPVTVRMGGPVVLWQVLAWRHRNVEYGLLQPLPFTFVYR